ncbi:hypothetical protein PPL_04241 [Heterostelium album PN500]|uniref:Uncharacterized protein n=1 Tax=Heterostelium pallidum (strain ATCC 26659 / Pp 5 / PN500) TaxID=670386 RepID=D3B710_HETP5|nr:hypothetical protein PPL_04241 [Heterostelium album PN500]EFA82553.1 hypothetical protein PPL_04241 [Heterostelium album PN500]|eukprot:XP_020434670.1 hypothetical protein PPL_04241 [Heterostelium album PN500]
MALFSNMTGMAQPISSVNNNNVLSGGQTQGINQMISQEMVKGEGVFANNPFMNLVNKSTNNISICGLGVAVLSTNHEDSIIFFSRLNISICEK